jgi:hypothetical protein
MITMIIMVADTVIGTIAAACVSRSRPQWRVKTHIDEPAGVAGVSIQPIRDVLCAGKPHDADGGGRAVQRLHRRQRLLASGLVVVFKYENVAAAQHLDEFGRPVAAAGERGRAVAQCGDAIRVLLAFANEDGAVRVLQQFRQPIQHAADVAELIHPAAVAVRPALAKSLRLVSLHLVEQRAAFVGVIVSRHHRRRWPAGAGLSHDGGHDGDIGIGDAFAAVAVGLPRRQAGFLAHVIPAPDRIVVGEAVHHEAVGSSRIDPDR